jgi:hypothetical protein
MHKFHSLDYASSITRKNTDEIKSFVKELQGELNNGVESEFFAPVFIDELKILLKDPIFNSYNTFSQYLTTSLDQLIGLEQVLVEASENDDDILDLEQELHFFWQNSEFCDYYFEEINLDKDIMTITEELGVLLQNQLIAFYYLHVAKTTKEFNPAICYNFCQEIGETESYLWAHSSGAAPMLVKLPEPREQVFISAIYPESVILKDFGEIALQKALTLEEEGIQLVMNQSDTAIEEKWSYAHSTIKTLLPDIAPILKHFTKRIFALSHEDVVSLSYQQAPYLSFINLKTRDRIDLIDDLFHENGHHYLNAHLNIDEYINEDDDKIFYSPWRESARPVRGIFHAYCTFYWAHEIFKRLSIKMLQGEREGFTEAEQGKILKRFAEEHAMLKSCFDEVKRAHKLKKVEKIGLELCQEFHKSILEVEELYQDTLIALKEYFPNDFAALKTYFQGHKEKAKEFKISVAPFDI